CLLGVAWVERKTAPPPPPPPRGGGGGGGGAGGGALREGGGGGWGVVGVGAVLVAPLTLGSLRARGLDGFWTWAALAATIATVEEIAIRGALYRQWAEEAAPVAPIVAGAIVFALIHLPRYGWGAMPLDRAVGLALGVLRALTGRVMPAAVAHTIADWGAWFWA